MAVSAPTKAALEAALQGMVSRLMATSGISEAQATSLANAAITASIATAGEVDTGTSTSKLMNVAQTKRKIDEAVAALVNAAPETLNTIAELSAALNNDPDIINDLTTLIGQKETPQGAQDKVDALAATVASTYATKTELATEIALVYTDLTAMLDAAAT